MTVLSPADIARCAAIAQMKRGPVNTAVLEIVQAVATQTGISWKAIMGRSRRADVVQSRQLVYWMARQQGYTLKAIGQAMGRDHTTIIHGIQAEEWRRARL